MRKSDLHRLFGINPKTLLLWEKSEENEKRRLLYFAIKQLTNEQIKLAEELANSQKRPKPKQSIKSLAKYVDMSSDWLYKMRKERPKIFELLWLGFLTKLKKDKQ